MGIYNKDYKVISKDETIEFINAYNKLVSYGTPEIYDITGWDTQKVVSTLSKYKEGNAMYDDADYTYFIFNIKNIILLNLCNSMSGSLSLNLVPYTDDVKTVNNNSTDNKFNGTSDNINTLNALDFENINIPSKSNVINSIKDPTKESYNYSEEPSESYATKTESIKPYSFGDDDFGDDFDGDYRDPSTFEITPEFLHYNRIKMVSNSILNPRVKETARQIFFNNKDILAQISFADMENYFRNIYLYKLNKKKLPERISNDIQRVYDLIHTEDKYGAVGVVAGIRILFDLFYKTTLEIISSDSDNSIRDAKLFLKHYSYFKSSSIKPLGTYIMHEESSSTYKHTMDIMTDVFSHETQIENCTDLINNMNNAFDSYITGLNIPIEWSNKMKAFTEIISDYFNNTYHLSSVFHNSFNTQDIEEIGNSLYTFVSDSYILLADFKECLQKSIDDIYISGECSESLYSSIQFITDMYANMHDSAPSQIDEVTEELKDCLGIAGESVSYLRSHLNHLRLFATPEYTKDITTWYNARAILRYILSQGKIMR